jgi:hypothetical protein
MLGELDELLNKLGGEPFHLDARRGAQYLWAYGSRVDPEMPNTQPLQALDRLGIRGDRLVKLVFEVCNGSFLLGLTLLKAQSLGIVTEAQINGIIDNGDPVDLPDLLTQVQKRFPLFGHVSC